MPVTVLQKPLFKRQYKKFTSKLKSYIDQAITTIINNPTVGQPKKGDLAGIRVYKFKVFNNQYLLAYSYINLNQSKNTSILLINIGTHENFYRNLKKS